MTELTPHQVWCMECHAQPNEECMTNTGKVRKPHQKRIELAWSESRVRTDGT